LYLANDERKGQAGLCQHSIAACNTLGIAKPVPSYERPAWGPDQG
jgi:hypothetical protein